jgi:microcin C transport system permease protein
LYAYLLRRLFLIIPTLIGIMIINFAVVQFVPGGPVEQMIAQLTGSAVDATARVGGEAGSEVGASAEKRPQAGGDGGLSSRYRGAQGLPPELIEDIERQFGLDKPALERFLYMMGNYIRFDFGDSFFQDKSVIQLVVDKMPVSISLGLWTTLLVYLISIPLGVAKAVRDGSKFDIWTSGLVIFGNAVPGFLFAILLIVLFAGGRYLDWFPLRGLTSPNFDELSTLAKIGDYFWHLALPLLSMVIGGFAGLTMLTKNSFIEEINKQYVLTARAKGLTQHRVLYGHIFRNAMLIVIAGFPAAFIGILFTGAMLTEIIFSLDGLGLLGFEAALKRDYPVMFGTLFFFTLLGLLMGIIGDIMYHIIDPRIDFDARDS